MMVLIVASTVRGIGYAWGDSEIVLLFGVLHYGPRLLLFGEPGGFWTLPLENGFENIWTHYSTASFWKLPTASDKVIDLPLGLPMLFAGLIWILTRLVHKGPRNLKGCLSCGYDLTGNQSGVCPECGQAIGASA